MISSQTPVGRLCIPANIWAENKEHVGMRHEGSLVVPGAEHATVGADEVAPNPFLHTQLEQAESVLQTCPRVHVCCCRWDYGNR